MNRIKIYLDNCTYNRPFDDQSQVKIALEAEAKRYIQQLVIEKTVDLTYSYVNRMENEDNPYNTRKNSIKAFFKNAVSYIYYTHVENIEKRASEIMRCSIKEKDALHISCAIENDCDYFITTDKRLLNYHSSDIVICSPIIFLDYLEETKDA
jgi:predicted nucleic acid-binding protein